MILARLGGLVRNMKSTKNWFSVLLVYFGFRSEVIAVFRNGSTFSVTKDSLPEYMAIRNLVSSGVRASKGADGLWMLEFPNGLRFLGRSNWSDGFTLYECFMRKVYETRQDLTDRVVVDIGAGIGDSSIYYASQGARVYAFEPTSESFELALRNIKINQMEDQITIFKSAISSHDGGATLFFNPAYPGYNTLLPLGGRTELYQARSNIDTCTLTSFLSRYHIEQIDLLKIDCEGCEFEVITPANAEALTRTKEIILEYHSTPTPIINLLKSLHFKVRVNRTASSDAIGSANSRIKSEFGILHASR